VSALRTIGAHWAVATRYADLLQRVLDELAAVGTSGTPESVKILADMRRTACDLDALISTAPRATVTADKQEVRVGMLEDLEVFDFFNYPRLPVGLEAPVSMSVTVTAPADGVERGAFNPGMGVGVSEFATGEGSWIV
jgi:hypothetical protein